MTCQLTLCAWLLLQLCVYKIHAGCQTVIGDVFCQCSHCWKIKCSCSRKLDAKSLYQHIAQLNRAWWRTKPIDPQGWSLGSTEHEEKLNLFTLPTNAYQASPDQRPSKVQYWRYVLPILKTRSQTLPLPPVRVLATELLAPSESQFYQAPACSCPLGPQW